MNGPGPYGTPEQHKLKRARQWALGKCGYGCGRDSVLPCGLCRECADKNKLRKRRWDDRRRALKAT